MESEAQESMGRSRDSEGKVSSPRTQVPLPNFSNSIF